MAAVDIRVRTTEGTETQPNYQWDTQFNGDTQTWDWVIAGYSDPDNVGGYLTTKPLDTAILLQLLTWKRARSHDALPSGSDPKGWWGDTVDLEPGETEMGSRLWLLYRSVLNDTVAQQAIIYVREALQPIIDQGAVVRFDVQAVANKVAGRLDLTVQGYSQDGQNIYSQKFSRLWAAEFESFSPSPAMSGQTNF